jgi:serine/threonine protein kinase
LEYVPGKDLFDILVTLYSRGMPVPLVFAIVREIAKTLEYIHSKKILHGDVKLENVIVTHLEESNQNVGIKLIDWEFAQDVTESVDFRSAGSRGYIAPEVANLTHVGTPGDIWSLGIIMYVLSTGELPFSSSQRFIEDQDGSFGVVKYSRPFPPEIEKIVSKIFVPHGQRISATKLLGILP